MAKVIKYKFIVGEAEGEPILADIAMGWNEINEETAKREAWDGVYTIVDDGLPEPDTASADDVLNAFLGVAE